METTMALIALAAVIVGPSIQLQIAKQQIRAQLVSANRLKWIEDVRSHVACFLAHWARLSKAIAENQPGEGAEAEAAVSMDEAIQTVRLLLNPQDSTHEALRNAMTDMFSYSLGKAGDVIAKRISTHEYFGTLTENLEERIEAVHASAREVLKTEWERVKRGE